MNTASLVLTLIALQASPAPQESPFRDPGVQPLIEMAIEARAAKIEGIESYEADTRETAYFGIRGSRFRRERGILQMERLGRVLWRRSGEHVVFWEGFQGAFVGIDIGVAEEGEGGVIMTSEGGEIRNDAIDDDEPWALQFDPDDDRLAFGDDWALNPLSEEGLPEYFYSLGDTLRISIPDGREITLVEVRVEPRETSFNLVAGSLWLDQSTGALARAAYRPGRPFNIELDEPDDAEEVPGFLKPIIGEINYILVDYALYDFQWWLPRRFAFQGEGKVSNFISAPITVEWSMTNYEVNPEETTLPEFGPLPEGWTRERHLQTKDDSVEVYRTVIVPSVEEVMNSPKLSDDLPGPEPERFSSDEVEAFQNVLDKLIPARPPMKRTLWGLEDGMIRYNRVEGLSVGIRQELPLSKRWAVEGTGRLGVADLEPSAEVVFRRGSVEDGIALGFYRRLDHSSDWADPFNVFSSLSNLLLGNDRGQYYRATGTDLRWDRRGRMFGGGVRLFYEDHEGVVKETDFHLQEPIGGLPMPELTPADEGRIGGARGRLNWQWGLDSDPVIASGRVVGEVGTGDFDYRRALAGVTVSYPLPFRLAGAFELQAGSTWGDVPFQKNFFLGSTGTLRGFKSASVVGASFWAARTEVSNQFPAARITLFTDFAWAGPRSAWSSFEDHKASVGVGLSALEGLLRFDIASIVQGGSGWDLIIYFDGIL